MILIKVFTYDVIILSGEMVESLKVISRYLYPSLWASTLLRVMKKLIEWREVGILVVATLTRVSIAAILTRALVVGRVLGILLSPTKEDEPKLKKFTLSKREKFINWFIANTNKIFRILKKEKNKKKIK